MEYRNEGNQKFNVITRPYTTRLHEQRSGHDHHISQGITAMQSAKLFHVLSVLLGIAGLLLWGVAIVVVPAGGVWLGQTREVMLMCAALSLLTAIWLLIGAMHHITLAKMGKSV
jgi:hypothetical protein